MCLYRGIYKYGLQKVDTKHIQREEHALSRGIAPTGRFLQILLTEIKIGNKMISLCAYDTVPIKTHGSESQGQERAKRIAKNKTRNELLCVFYTSERFRNMTS